MTQEELQQRIDDYCARYGVRERKPDGLPPYPAGEREEPAHRDWIVLYKAVSRFRKRQSGLPASPERHAAIEAQNGRCPICLADVGAEGRLAHQPQAGATMTVVHSECDELLRKVLTLGPSALDRLRAYAWPEARSSGKPGRTR